MYVINEWLERYEVNDKGQPARPGDKLRVRPLDYIRSKCHGKRRSAGFAVMQKHAGDKAYEVFGLFQKFLEIAGDDVGGQRGTLLNARGKPATTKDLALMLTFPEDKIIFAMQVLTNEEVGWIKDVSDEQFLKFQENQESQNQGQNQNQIEEDKSRNSRNSRKIAAAYITEPNRTEQNETKHNRTEGLQENPENQNKKENKNQVNNDFGLGNFNATSFRFRFVTALEKILSARTSSDRKSLQNLVNWLNLQVVAKRFDDGIFRNVLDIAIESKNGSRKPMAVFFAKLNESIGYRAKAAKQLRDSQ